MRFSRNESETREGAAYQQFYSSDCNNQETPENHKMGYTGKSVIFNESFLAEHIYDHLLDPLRDVIKAHLVFTNTKNLDKCIYVVKEKPEGADYQYRHNNRFHKMPPKSAIVFFYYTGTTNILINKQYISQYK